MGHLEQRSSTCHSNTAYPPLHTAQLALLPDALVLLAACSSKIPASVNHRRRRPVEIATAGRATPRPSSSRRASARTGLTGTSSPARCLRLRACSPFAPRLRRQRPGDDPREAEQIVEELRRLLASQDMRPLRVVAIPTGAYMELFAKSHPEEVLGAVLVRPTPPRLPHHLRGGQAGLMRYPGVDTRDTGAERDRRVPRVRHGVRRHPRRGGVRLLSGSCPHGDQSSGLASKRGAVADDARLRSPRRQPTVSIIVQGSSHHIQLDRPAEVVRAITAMLPSPPTSP